MQNRQKVYKTNLYLEDIIRAIESISPSYIANANTPHHLAERIFAYEFYHQYRMLMYDNNEYNNAFLCGEQSKLFRDKHDEKCDIENMIQSCPDIVLAGDIENSITETQYWVAEIKMAGNATWKGDIPKLVTYAKSQLGFKYLFYIFVCKNMNQRQSIFQKLNNYEFTKDELAINILICSIEKEDTKEVIKVALYKNIASKK